jgi:hypothetical protein
LRSTMRFTKMVTNHGNRLGPALGVNPLRMKTKPMSLLGQSRRFGDVRVTSAFPLIADLRQRGRQVRKSASNGH